MEKLPGDYIAGFVDGEGCFALKFRKDIRYERKNKPTYFYWDIEFAILLRADDKSLLEKICFTMGCGRISTSAHNSARYAVNNIDELTSIIIPFFDKYKLHGKKQHDFELWKAAAVIMRKNHGLKTNISSTNNPRGARKNSWDPQDLKEMESIHERMKAYKSKVPDWKWLAMNKPKAV